MLLAHLLAAAVVVLFPLWDVWEARQLREAVRPGAKSPIYLRIIAVLWLFACAVLLVFPLSSLFRPPPAPGAPWRELSPTTAWIIAAAAGVGQLLPVLFARFDPGLRARLAAAFDEIGYLLPRTAREKLLFAGVSVTAGITEELIYRGFLMRYLAAGPWGLSATAALAVSSVAFGVAHAGQGAKGMLLTGVVGLLLGGLYLASGSLLLPILLHTLIDLRALAMAHLTRREAPA
jgi:membrane protease YdiL (CAAX protease family)